MATIGLCTMLLEAVVEFEYTAEQDDELSCKVGDRITNVQTVEGGWCEGELNGKRGMFPENFVKLVKSPETPAKEIESKREAPQRKSVRELASQFKDNLPVGPQKKKEKQKRCKALFHYVKDNNDELDLALGDIIEFHRQVEDGWWEGSLNGRTGVFPSNFVEMLEDTASPGEGSPTGVGEKDKSTVEAPSKDPDSNSIKGKKVVGVGLGNIFDKGPIKLFAVGDSAKKEDSSKPARQENLEQAPEEAVLRNKSNSNLPSFTEQAVVRFSYASEQADELSLLEGQIVRILDKNLEDEGWWKGELNGKVGIFPDNFVELLPNEETNKPKKLPAPVAPTTKGALPKLPEKTPIGDTSADKIKSDAQSPFAGRKPQMPPPMLRKPVNQTSVETKPEPSIPHHQATSMRDKSLIKENSLENHHSQDSTNFDDIEPGSQKLTHLTFGRAPAPKKRPPSSAIVLNEAEKNAMLEENKIINLVPAPEKQQSRLQERPDKPLPVLPPKDYKYQTQPPMQTEHISLTPQPTSGGTSLRDRDHHTSTPVSRPPEPTKALPLHTANATNQQTIKLIEQLNLQLNELKSNSVSKTMFKELQIQHEKLKMEFENMKKNHAMKIRDLSSEVDTEKKLRLTTQKEIELVKKSLAESEI